MSDLITDLGKLIRTQQDRVHSILDEMERSEGRHYDYLESHLERQVIARDLLLDLMETLINGDESDGLL